MPPLPARGGKIAPASPSASPASASPAQIPSAQSTHEQSPRLFRAHSRPRRLLTAWDGVGILAGVALTLTITVVNSRGRIFWEDEMLGWMLLRDPSWRHMLHAWNLGADGGGFSFYLLGRAWFHLFGASVLTFRLFSSCCFAAAFAATWVALRRFYSPAIVAFAAANTFFFSPPLTMHFLEGRFYGLLVLGTALALWLALVLDEAAAPLPPRLLFAAFLVHGLLTTSHVLGVIYSASLLAATILVDHLRHRRRLRLYLTIAAAWLLLLPEHQSILAAGLVGKPHFWTVAPNGPVILGAYTGFSHEILTVLLALFAVAALVLGRSLGRGPGGLRQALRNRVEQRPAVYVVALALLLVPVVFLVQGLFSTWLFTDRYLQPVTLGLAVVTAELVSITFSPRWLRGAAQRLLPLTWATALSAALAYSALLLYWDFHHVAMTTPQAPDFTGALTAHLPHDLPVVIEDGFTFTGLLSREASSGVQYTFLLDWAYAISPEAPRVEVTQYHLMQNWQRAGYFRDRIQPLASFLQAHPRFLVVHGDLVHPDPAVKPIIGNPLTGRFAHDPHFEVRPYFTLDRLYRDSVRDTVSLVCRDTCGPEPVTPAQPDHCVLWKGGVTCCNGPDCHVPPPDNTHPHRFLPVAAPHRRLPPPTGVVAAVTHP